MNRKEYEEYCRTVEQFFTDEGITNLSLVYDDDQPTEPVSSAGLCDCCGTNSYGYRYEASGFYPGDPSMSGQGKMVKYYVVCRDCLYYAEHGRLDDQTMLDIDAQTEEESHG